MNLYLLVAFGMASVSAAIEAYIAGMDWFSWRRIVRSRISGAHMTYFYAPRNVHEADTK